MRGRVRLKQLKQQAAYTMANANQAIDQAEEKLEQAGELIDNANAKIDQAGELMTKLDSIATDLKSLTVLVAMMANAVAEYFDDDDDEENA